MAGTDIKQFLYAWLGKKKVTPNYDFRASGSKHRQRFACDVSTLKLFRVSVYVPAIEECLAEGRHRKICLEVPGHLSTTGY